MKKCFNILFAFLMIPVVSAWENAMSVDGGVEIELLRDGNAAYEIVYEDDGQQQAADLLAQGLSVVTGKNFPINSGDASLKKIRLETGSSELGLDGMEIRIDEHGNLTLLGGSRKGALFAVASLLGEDLNLRHYNFKYLPSMPGGVLSHARVLPRRFVPPFMQRSPYAFWSLGNEQWNKLNRTRVGNFGKYFVHTIFELIPPNEFLSTHPEFFSQIGGKPVSRWQDGQLCMSQPELKKIMAERIIAILDKNPEIEFFALSQNDADGPCVCAACIAVDRQEGSPSGALLRFVNDVAAIVGEKHPRVTIVTEAYRYSLKAPKITRPRDNVVVRLCLNNRIAAYPFFTVAETPDLQVFDDWTRKTDRLLIWDYITDFRNYLSPRADLPVLQDNLRFYRDRKVTGVMLQSNYSNELGTLAAMRAWVLAQLLWNPDWDINRLSDDYLYGVWGPDAGADLVAYKNLLNSEWEEFHRKNRPGTPFRFSREFYKQASAILNQARTKLTGNQLLLDDLELEELTLDYYLLEQGVHNDSEVAAYQQAITRFGERLDKHKIDHLLEGGYGMAKKRLAQWQDGIVMLKHRKNVRPGAILLPVSWNVYNTVLADDDAALAGKAQKQTDGWAIQWRFEDFANISSGTYQVRIRVKGDAPLVVGVYNGAKSSYALSRTIASAEMSPSEYRWIDCGSVDIVIGEQMFLYSAPGNSPGTIWVDSIELTPKAGKIPALR